MLCVPAFVAHAASGVVINEIAWMGTKGNASDEWIELYNSSSQAVDLSGWKLMEGGGGVKIIEFSGTGFSTASIPAGGYYLIERGDDGTIAGITADLSGSFGGNGLSNAGEYLVLKNAAGETEDEVNASAGWFAGSASPDYLSMERISAAVSGNLGSNWGANSASSGSGSDSKGNVIRGTPRAANSVSGSSPQQSGQSANEEEVSSPVSLASVPKLPTFKVDAGPDRVGIAGADMEFSGRAFGFTDEPLEGGRFLWIFGDGTTADGRSIKHTYRFPGVYLLSLSISSGQESASDYAQVTVRENSVSISEVKIGPEGYIELSNASNDMIDIGSWIVANDLESKEFIIPSGTKMPARSFVPLPNEETGLGSGGGIFTLMYPNKRHASRVILPEPSRTDGSYHWTGGEMLSFSGRATPGSGYTAASAAPRIEPVVSHSSALPEPVSQPADETAAEDLSAQSATLGFSGTAMPLVGAAFVSAAGAAGFLMLRKRMIE